MENAVWFRERFIVLPDFHHNIHHYVHQVYNCQLIKIYLRCHRVEHWWLIFNHYLLFFGTIYIVYRILIHVVWPKQWIGYHSLPWIYLIQFSRYKFNWKDHFTFVIFHSLWQSTTKDDDDDDHLRFREQMYSINENR